MDANDGNRGGSFSLSPAVQYSGEGWFLSAKRQDESGVHNRTEGQTYWLKFTTCRSEGSSGALPPPGGASPPAQGGSLPLEPVADLRATHAQHLRRRGEVAAGAFQGKVHQALLDLLQ